MENIIRTMKERREEFRCTLADSWDSECTNKSVDRERAFCFDSGHEIIDGFFFVSLDLEKLISVVSEIINRCHIGDPTELTEELDLLWSESIDIDAVLAHEPFESLHLTSRTCGIATEESDFFSFFVCR